MMQNTEHTQTTRFPPPGEYIRTAWILPQPEDTSVGRKNSADQSSVVRFNFEAGRYRTECPLIKSNALNFSAKHTFKIFLEFVEK